MLRPARISRQFSLARQGCDLYSRSWLGPLFVRPRRRERPVRIRFSLRRRADDVRSLYFLSLYGKALCEGRRTACDHDAEALRRPDWNGGALQHVTVRACEWAESVCLLAI